MYFLKMGSDSTAKSNPRSSNPGMQILTIDTVHNYI